MSELYLDNAATTRCHPEVAAVALEMMTTEYGNPSSLHAKGLQAELRVDAARTQLALALGCAADELFFTSGGTEANNIAILGAAAALRKKGNSIVATTTLHASASKPLEILENQGFLVRYIDPCSDGNTDIDALSAAVNSDTILLVAEFVNSEVGAVTPIEQLSRLVRRKNKDVHIHIDGVQALGKVAFAAKRLDIDSMAVSAHKIFAPKGCGGLYLRKSARLLPILHGGEQERALRPGTENTPAICAFGHAAALATRDYAMRLEQVAAVREYFVNKVAISPELCINSPINATPYISNISVLGFRSETLLHFMASRGIYLSSGSACSKGAVSHVLRAMGLSPLHLDSALRISLSFENTIADIDRFFDTLTEGIATLARSKH